MSTNNRPFKWGDFAQFVDTMAFESEVTDLHQPATGTEFGSIDLLEAAGEGSISYLCSDALRVLIFDCAFRDEHTFNVIDDGWIRLNFSLSISVDMAFSGRRRENVISPSWRLVSMPPDEVTVESIAPDLQLRWVTVCCRPDLLGRLADTSPENLPLGENYDTLHAGDFAYRPFQFTPSLKSATVEIIASRPHGNLRASYVAVKAQELLVLGLDCMLNGQSAETLSHRVKLSERDIGGLNAARAILGQELANPPTVANLALRVGLNRNKLFYGFKSLFGVSISEHLQQQRIAKGYELLLDTDSPISEIAAQIGFRHQCNFSTAFRARHGMTPSQLRTQRPI